MTPEIDALARRHGWTLEEVEAVRELVERAVDIPLLSSEWIVSRGADIPPLSSQWVEAHPVEPADPGPTARAPRPSGDGRRYRDLGLIGTGGMGEVRRVRDPDLRRTVAMKIIRTPLLERPPALARFVEEAQTAAQLQHPGIVPVHEIGRLADGRAYFTMPEVRGRTMGEVIAAVHRASQDSWQPDEEGWTFRRLVDAFLRLCEAVAYAHARGVVHRDLKPNNVMLGTHGEVLVLDWGLAKVLGRWDLVAEAGQLDPVLTDRSQDGAMATSPGHVAGTPAYMPPEQARGDANAVDARSDVYAMGAILYELLSGRAPYAGRSGGAVVRKVLAGPPEPLRSLDEPGESLGFGASWGGLVPRRAGPPLPPDLVAACERAMARDPEERFRDATALAKEIAAWLDGARRRAQALAVVEEADRRVPRMEAERTLAAALRAEAAALLKEVQPWQPEEDKAPGWAKEDEAERLERHSQALEVEREQLLAGSLTHAPDLAEAHAALAGRYRAEHEAAEADRRDPARAEALLRAHAAALPPTHPARARHFAYLRGDGALTLVTDPPGAEVLLHRYVLRHRRLVPGLERSLGRTPLIGVSLPQGSYLCVVRHPERAEVQYPVVIGRCEHWHGASPGSSDPEPVWLPGTGDLAADDCYVPAGWFWSGGDPQAIGSLPRRRLWCDGLVLKRFPVTNTEYICFLDDLVATGREQEALRCAPRERAGTEGGEGALIYHFDGRRFTLRPDADGDVWDPEFPVVMVDWPGARAYGAWRAARQGLPWRLPGELEWEKAARGVDGRCFPWGDAFDPSWCCMRDSHRDRPLPAIVESYPVDAGPFGVRGMAGNSRDWCADAWSADGTALDDGRCPTTPTDPPGAALCIVRGGSWNYSPRSVRLSNRDGAPPGARNSVLGLRLARSIPGASRS